MKHGPLGIHLGVSHPAETEAVVAEFKLGTVQFFTHNPRGWGFAPLDTRRLEQLRNVWQAHGVAPLVSHCNYLINLGTRSSPVREKSIACLQQELAYAAAFGCHFFVLHVGKYKEEGLAQGIRNVIDGLNAVKEAILKHQVMILLETVAGQGTEIGRNFRDLGAILKGVDEALKPFLGVCLDTCHVFAAGYDLRTPEKVQFLVDEFEREIGWDRLKVVHLNDSRKGLGEHVDRHAHIGLGAIGEAGFTAFLNHPRIAPLPKILETPVDEERGYAENLAVVRRLQR